MFARSVWQVAHCWVLGNIAGLLNSVEGNQACLVHCCRYLENVPTIVPVLEKEYRNASRRLEETQSELGDMHPEKLKVRNCSSLVDILSQWGTALQGTAKLASPLLCPSDLGCQCVSMWKLRADIMSS